jgi:hypothetical protein
MSGTAANTTNDVSSEVPLLRTVVFAVTHTATILADLVFVVTEGTVESGEFPKLIAFMIILTFWSGCSRFDNPVDHFDASRHFLFTFTENKAMKVFFGIICILIGSSFSLFDTPFPSDADLGTTFPLHFLQAITTGTNEQTEEINLGEFFDRNVNLFRWTLITLLLVIFNGRAEIRIIFHGSIDKSDAFIFELFAIANLASISTTTLTIVSRRRRGGALAFRGYEVIQP